MIQILGIDNTVRQQFIQSFAETDFTLRLQYSYAALRWNVSINWQDKLIFNGFKLIHGNLLLKQYKNILPFDLLCITSDGQPPYSIESFTIGNAVGENYGLFILNQEEANQYEQILFSAFQ